MPPASSGQFANHLAPGIVGIIGTDLQEKGKDTFYSKFVTEETGPARNYFDYLAAAGLPMAQIKLENDPIASVDPLEGGTKRVQYDEWALGFEVTQIAWEDDLYGDRGSALRSAATGLSDSLIERREVEAHRPFNAEGFVTTTWSVLPDNTAFFATSHAPIAGGEAGAQANRPTTDVAFSITSYRNARIAMQKYTDDRGNRIPRYAKPKRLIGGVDLEWAFREIIQNPTRADSVASIKNFHLNDVEIIVTPYITDINRWILQAQNHFLKFFRRRKPMFDNFDDRRRRCAIFVAWERYKVQPLHWLGHYASDPA